MHLLIRTLERINNLYGRGEVTGILPRHRVALVDVPTAHGTSYVDRVRYSVKGDFVTFRGHRRRFGYSRTPVLFRVFRQGGDVIALFPALPSYDGMVMSYQHVGQHVAANLGGCIRQSRPATRAEYRDLKRELEGRGYRLQVYARVPADAGRMRDLVLRCMRGR